MSHGWRVTSVLIILGVALSTAIPGRAFAATIRDIAVNDSEKAIFVFDTPIRARAVSLEYQHDTVQLTLEGASIYPAKIDSYPNGNFTKIFAYQYSPNAVRVKFNVPADAVLYRGKVKINISGKTLSISFPKLEGAAKSAINEESLLARVLGADTKPVAKAPVQDIENEPIKVGLRKEPPSPMRAILVMGLMLGGLSIFLFWIKKKQGRSQTSAKGGFLSQLIPQQWKKSPQFIEVMANTPLGPKQNILLVKIRGQQFVLGVTQDRIQLITQIDGHMNDALENDLLGDPNVSASLSKMFSADVAPSGPIGASSAGSATYASRSLMPSAKASFETILNQSNGASYRDKIRKKMGAMKSL